MIIITRKCRWFHNHLLPINSSNAQRKVPQAFEIFCNCKPLACLCRNSEIWAEEWSKSLCTLRFTIPDIVDLPMRNWYDNDTKLSPDAKNRNRWEFRWWICLLKHCVLFFMCDDIALLSHEDNFCMQQRHDSSTTRVNFDIHHVGFNQKSSKCISN